MARTRNSFTGSAGDDTLIDKVLGRSYDIVKAVYLKLPELEELQSNPNINTLVDNFDTVQEVSKSANSIINVNNNLDDILAASSYSAKALNASEEAKSSAVTATAASQEAANTLNEAITVRDSLQEYEANLDTVATNIEAVKTTSANITQINYIASTIRDSLTISKIEEILANIQEITTLSQNINEVVQVANKFIGTGELDKIETASQDIQNSLQEYYQVLEDMRQEVINASNNINRINDTVIAGINTVNLEAQARRTEIASVKQECETLLEQVVQGNKIVSTNVDTANDILLKIRDIYHSFEMGINALNKKILLGIHHEGDHQLYRVREEGDLQADRLYTQMSDIIASTAEKMEEKANEILNQKLEELQTKADEIIAQIQTMIDDVNFDITELTNKVIDLEQKIQEIASVNRGDIRFGYVDYSQKENQEKMVVGTTYIVPFDENGQYIQINPDTNDFERDPAVLRFYIKSISGNVSYVPKDIRLDLSLYLKKEDLKQATTDISGIVELATVSEVEAGVDAIRVITPFTLNKALPQLLINNFQQNPNGLTNTIVQQIVKTIADDRHLQEDLASSIADELEDIGIGTIKPDEDITFEESITVNKDLIVKGDSTFEGNITVPDQQPQDNSESWPDNTVLNKGDVVNLINSTKKNNIVILDSYPTSIDSLEDNVFYCCPVRESGTEILITTLRENESSSASVKLGEQAFFAAGDLL